MNHYDALGVPRDADAATIKKAYQKKRSGGAHPDRGGDHAAMTTITVAYEILSNPDKRSYYDATGQNKPVDSLENQARQVVVAIVLGILEDAPDHIHVVLTAQQAIQQGITENNKQLNQIPGKVAKLKKRRSRVISKGQGINFLVQAIDSKIEEYGHLTAKIQEALRVQERAFKILEGFDYEMPVQQGWAGVFVINIGG